MTTAMTFAKTLKAASGSRIDIQAMFARPFLSAQE
jgi:hypothetical protein